VRVVLAVEEEARDVARVDRLQQEHVLARLRRRPGQVVHVGGLQLGAVGAVGRQAGHQVDARAAQGLRVFERARHAAAELVLPAGQAGQAALARGPVARRRVEQYLLQPVRAQPRRQLGGRMLVGKQVFHRVEAVGRGGGEAVQEGMLVVEHRQVGGKAGHRRRTPLKGRA
jgi:hypothetical protein